MIINNGKVVYEVILDIAERESVIENKQLMNMPGIYKFKLEVYPLNYRGMEYSKDIQFEVKASSEKRTVKNLH